MKIFDKPLAELIRPQDFSRFVGQEQLLKNNSFLHKIIENDDLSSFILWGPPGSGKTTIANIIKNRTDDIFLSFSAVTSSIKDVKAIMKDAEIHFVNNHKKTIIFVDEIHRFNKAQQDAFLSFVENGSVVLIGATTENPSFSVISPLLSRMRVFILESINEDGIRDIIKSAFDYLEQNKGISIEMAEDDIASLIKVAGGDARRTLGIVESAIKISSMENNKIIVKHDTLLDVLQGRLPSYDKTGDFHYNYISALHKSMRNSDVDAALYYAVKMMESGEDYLYITRRVIQFSAEDIGLADPEALKIAVAAHETVKKIGAPESNFAVMEAVAYCALAPKSNALYSAYLDIVKDIKSNPDLPVPMSIRNAPTKLMKEAGYGEGYQYAHDNKVPITNMQCLPDKLKDKRYYRPKQFGFEKDLSRRIERINEIKGRK